MLGEDLVPVMDKVLMPAFLSDDRPQLLQRPVRARVRCHIDVGQPTRTVLDDNKYIEHSKRRSDSHEEVACENRFCMILQEGRPALIPTVPVQQRASARLRCRRRRPMTKRQDRGSIYVKRQFDTEIIVLCVRWYSAY